MTPGRCLILGIAALVLAGCSRSQPRQHSPREHLNKGYAALAAGRFGEAESAFQTALKIDPAHLPSRINLALSALQNRNYQLAASTLEPLDAQPFSDGFTAIQVAYLRGMALREDGQPAAAVKLLERAASLDPGDAAISYQYALALADHVEVDRALEVLNRVLTLDRMHLGAHFQKSRLLQRKRDPEAELWTLRYERAYAIFGAEVLTRENFGVNRYTRPVDPPLPVQPENLFAPFQLVSKNDVFPRQPGVLLPFVQEGQMVMAFQDTDSLQVLKLADSRWVKGFEIKNPGPAQLVAGDLNNDGFTDLVSAGPGGLRLFFGSRDNTFEDVTTSMGFETSRQRSLALLDDDHDGDPDLWCLSEENRLMVLRNDGTGQLTEDAGLLVPQDVDLSQVLHLDAAEINDDDAIDILLTGTAAASVWRNAGLGDFDALSLPPLSWPGEHRALTFLDLDGHPEMELVRVERQKHGPWTIVCDGRVLAHMEPGVEVYDILADDVDGDGWTDLILLGSRGLRLLRRSGAAQFSDITSRVAAEADFTIAQGSHLSTEDIDGDGDIDILISGPATPPIQVENRPVTPTRSIRVHLQGTRSRRDAAGSRLVLRSGDFRAVRWMNRGQRTIPVGQITRLDSLTVIWNNGATDARENLDPGVQPTWVEPMIALGSCPYLYIQDQDHFRFVTDILGNSPLGLSLNRNRVLDADTDELVALPDVETSSGQIVLRITDELREIIYLDHLQIWAVDSSPEIMAVVTDKLMPPPFPPSEVIGVRSPGPPDRVIDHLGRDQTRALAKIDGVKYGPVQVRPPQQRGLAEPHSIVMDFAALPGLTKPVLILNGWLQYGDASVNVGASQNPRLSPPFPVLDAKTSDGQWLELPVIVGAPAGKTKTICVLLQDVLPPGTTSLRLRSSAEIWWDAIFIGERAELDSIEQIDPDLAEFAYRGVSRLGRSRPIDPWVPDHDDLLRSPPWHGDIRGYATRYGDVLSLLRATDDQFVIFARGDALTARFNIAHLPPLRPGQKRQFFAYTDGWDKDADHNVRTGRTIDPLPRHGQDDQSYGKPASTSHLPPLWTYEWNTRWVGPR